ncbi:MAG: metallophosphoesterase [Rhodoblastus sp.]|nr:MAG: metallophosphoesterase [Rhodoblastus sp.]
MTLLLAHLTDAHIGPLPRVMRRELLSKRITGYINFKVGRDRVHDMDVLARLVTDMLAHRPDHVAMTGDILNIGLQAEFPLARAWLETLGAPEQVSFAPGNHDAYVRSTLAHLTRTFAPYCRDDGAAETQRSHFPYTRVRQGVALIGLSTGVPTAPFIASGRLGAEQVEALGAALDAAKARGLARVVMMHHPPVKAAARGLTDVRAFEAILRKHGAELVLHGHNHRASVGYLEGPGGSAIPFVGAPSASLVRGRFRAAYHLYRITPKPDGAVEIVGHSRGLQAGTLEIGDIGPIVIAR